METQVSSHEPYRNLMVHGLNHALKSGHLSLKRNPNYLTIKMNGGQNPSTNHIKTLIGGYPSIVIWGDLGHEEIRLTVWWKFYNDKHPRIAEERFVSRTPLCKKAKWKNFLGVACTADVEREKGPHIMGEGKNHLSNIYTRKDELNNLKQLPIATASGFLATGKYYV